MLAIWPYAVAPVIAGALWLFMFQPSLGVIARGIRALGGRPEIVDPGRRQRRVRVERW